MDNQENKQNNILNGIKIPRPDKILKNAIGMAVCKQIQLENAIHKGIISAVRMDSERHEKIISMFTDQSETKQ